MARPVLQSFHVAEHDSRGGAKPLRVRSPHDIDPFARLDFVGAKGSANLVIKDFRSRPGQRSKACRFKLHQEFFQRNAECSCALPDLEW